MCLLLFRSQFVHHHIRPPLIFIPPFILDGLAFEDPFERFSHDLMVYGDVFQIDMATYELFNQIRYLHAACVITGICGFGARACSPC